MGRVAEGRSGTLTGAHFSQWAGVQLFLKQVLGWGESEGSCPLGVLTLQVHKKLSVSAEREEKGPPQQR